MELDLSNGLIIGDRHPGTKHFARLFSYAYLTPELQEISSRFAGLAQYLIEVLEDGPELSTALRKLLEGKDCAVRARLG